MNEIEELGWWPTPATQLGRRLGTNQLDVCHTLTFPRQGGKETREGVGTPEQKQKVVTLPRGPHAKEREYCWALRYPTQQQPNSTPRSSEQEVPDSHNPSGCSRRRMERSKALQAVWKALAPASKWCWLSPAASVSWPEVCLGLHDLCFGSELLGSAVTLRSLKKRPNSDIRVNSVKTTNLV